MHLEQSWRKKDDLVPPHLPRLFPLLISFFQNLLFIIQFLSTSKRYLEFDSIVFQIQTSRDDRKSSFFCFDFKSPNRFFVKEHFSLSSWTHRVLCKFVVRDMHPNHPHLSSPDHDIRTLEVTISCPNAFDFGSGKFDSCFEVIKHLIVMIGFFVSVKCGRIFFHLESVGRAGRSLVSFIGFISLMRFADKQIWGLGWNTVWAVVMIGV